MEIENFFQNKKFHFCISVISLFFIGIVSELTDHPIGLIQTRKRTAKEQIDIQRVS